MNKKIMFLVLGATSVMMLAVPVMASAMTSLHLGPSPLGGQAVHGIGATTLTTVGASGVTTISCSGFGGSATFEAGGGGTTGTITLTFGAGCTTNVGGSCTNTGINGNNRITTGTLPFHLATVEGAAGAVGPGILVTPANEHFASFTCHGIGGFLTVDSVVKGNGVIGTITSPNCGEVGNQATISFSTTSPGNQRHTRLAGTVTEYTLKKETENAALTAYGTLTFSTGNTLLQCT